MWRAGSNTVPADQSLADMKLMLHQAACVQLAGLCSPRATPMATWKCGGLAPAEVTSSFVVGGGPGGTPRATGHPCSRSPLQTAGATVHGTMHDCVHADCCPGLGELPMCSKSTCRTWPTSLAFPLQLTPAEPTLTVTLTVGKASLSVTVHGCEIAMSRSGLCLSLVRPRPQRDDTASVNSLCVTSSRFKLLTCMDTAGIC